MTLDELDKRILQQLQQNNAISNQELASLVHASAPTCLRRVARLVKEGFIEKQVAIIYLGTQGLLREVSVKKVKEFEEHFLMEMEQKSAENKMQKRPILLALIVGCCVAIAMIWHRSEIKKAVEQATSQTQSAEFPYTLEAVESVLDEQLSGWNNGNIDQFMRGYVQDSTVRFITNKKVKTKNKTL